MPGSEEARAERAQEAGFVGRGSSSVMLLVHDDRFSAPSTEFDQRVAGVIQQITADPRLQIRSQTGWSPLPAPQRDEFLGRDARTTLTTLELGIDDGTAKRVLPEVEREFSRFDAAGLRVYLVGQSAAFAATNEVGAAALTRVELILFPLVVAILMILYRSVAAALISLVVSVTAIVVAMGVLTWLAGVVELNVVVQSIATMLGLGVSVDYSLIMIRRFIDELTSSDRGTALTNTMRTAGRTVAASGTTVAAALVTLLIVDMPVIRSMAVAAIIVVVAGGPRMSCCPSRGVVPARSSRGGLARAVAAVHPGAGPPPLGQICPEHHGQTGCRVDDHVCRPACHRGAGAWTTDGHRRRLGSAEEFVGARGLRSGRGAVRERRRRADTGRHRSRPTILRHRRFHPRSGDDHRLQPAGPCRTRRFADFCPGSRDAR